MFLSKNLHRFINEVALQFPTVTEELVKAWAEHFNVTGDLWQEVTTSGWFTNEDSPLNYTLNKTLINESRFSSGNWSIPHMAAPDVNCECGYVLSETGMGAVCTVHASTQGDLGSCECGDNPKFTEAIANAFLIGNSPKLYNSLERIRALWTERMGYNPPSEEEWKAAMLEAETVLAQSRGFYPKWRFFESEERYAWFAKMKELGFCRTI